MLMKWGNNRTKPKNIRWYQSLVTNLHYCIVVVLCIVLQTKNGCIFSTFTGFIALHLKYFKLHSAALNQPQGYYY